MECQYCARHCKSTKSKVQHEVRCKSNPDRIVVVPTKGNTGKKHSDETRKRLSDSTKSLHQAGVFGAPPSWKGRTHTAETRMKISQSMCGNRNADHRGDRQSYYGNTRMDSRWEVATAQYLDANGYSWKYSVSGFTLSDGRVYYPDFFVYNEKGDLDHLIEVKGYFREANRLKFEQFKAEYPDVRILLWMKDDLKSLGII